MVRRFYCSGDFLLRAAAIVCLDRCNAEPIAKSRLYLSIYFHLAAVGDVLCTFPAMDESKKAIAKRIKKAESLLRCILVDDHFGNFPFNDQIGFGRFYDFVNRNARSTLDKFKTFWRDFHDGQFGDNFLDASNAC